jgi:hypothetical protein
MREPRDWHEAKRDAPRHARDAAADAPGKHARDSPKHEAHDSLKLKMLLDPAARKAEFFRYQRAVQEYEAKHVAGHRQPQEAKPEHAPPETTDKPTSRIAKRREPADQQELKQARPQRSWVPRADVVQAISNIGMFATSFAVALNDIPAKWDAVAASGVAAVVANVALANRRWKEKHGDRSEG